MDDEAIFPSTYKILLDILGLGKKAEHAGFLQAAMPRNADWDDLLRTAYHQGVFPLVYRRLSHAAPGVLPPAFLLRIQDTYRTLEHRNLRATGELIRLLAFLERHGLLALPFKGPVLSQVAYGDLALRQFVDLDLLVRPGDIPKLKNLVLSMGYRLEHAYTPKQEQVYLHNTCEFSFFHPRKAILDVHWRFAPNCLGGGPNVDKAFVRRYPVNLLGKTVYTLSPLDHLLALCLHGFNPGIHLSQISDVANLIYSQPHWHWEALLHEAEAGGMRRAVLLTLSLAHEILGAPVPSHITALTAEDHAVARLRRQVLQSLFSYPQKEPGLFSAALFQVQTQERLRDKLNYVWTGSFIPTVQDWQWVSLPDSRYWLYYFLRPCRLFTQGILGRSASRKLDHTK